MEEVVPEQWRTQIVAIDIDWEAPIVNDAYRDLCCSYMKKHNAAPLGVAGLMCNHEALL